MRKYQYKDLTIQAEEGTSLRLGIPSWDWCFGLHLEISIRVI